MVYYGKVWYTMVRYGMVGIGIGSAVNRLRISFESLQSHFWLGNIFVWEIFSTIYLGVGAKKARNSIHSVVAAFITALHCEPVPPRSGL